VQRGLLQIATTEQQLDGAKIHTGFEQVSGEALPGINQTLISFESARP